MKSNSCSRFSSDSLARRKAPPEVQQAESLREPQAKRRCRCLHEPRGRRPTLRLASESDGSMLGLPFGGVRVAGADRFTGTPTLILNMNYTKRSTLPLRIPAGVSLAGSAARYASGSI